MYFRRRPFPPGQLIAGRTRNVGFSRFSSALDCASDGFARGTVAQSRYRLQIPVENSRRCYGASDAEANLLPLYPSEPLFKYTRRLHLPDILSHGRFRIGTLYEYRDI